MIDADGGSAGWGRCHRFGCAAVCPEEQSAEIDESRMAYDFAHGAMGRRMTVGRGIVFGCRSACEQDSVPCRIVRRITSIIGVCTGKRTFGKENPLFSFL